MTMIESFLGLSKRTYNSLHYGFLAAQLLPTCLMSVSAPVVYSQTSPVSLTRINGTANTSVEVRVEAAGGTGSFEDIAWDSDSGNISTWSSTHPDGAGAAAQDPWGEASGNAYASAAGGATWAQNITQGYVQIVYGAGNEPGGFGLLRGFAGGTGEATWRMGNPGTGEPWIEAKITFVCSGGPGAGPPPTILWYVFTNSTIEVASTNLDCSCGTDGLMHVHGVLMGLNGPQNIDITTQTGTIQFTAREYVGRDDVFATRASCGNQALIVSNQQEDGYWLGLTGSSSATVTLKAFVGNP
jgi:hypothetical protein